MTTTKPLPARRFSRPVLFLLSCVLILGLFVWSLLNYRIEPTQPIFYGRRAIYSIILLAVVLALLGRVLLIRILRVELGGRSDYHTSYALTWQLLLLLDVAAPIYLAAGVLLGVFAAVLAALVTQTIVQGYTRWRGLISWTDAVYRVAATGLVMLVAVTVFQSIEVVFLPASPKLRPGTSYLESWELLGTLLAALVMMLLFIAIALLVIMQSRRLGLRTAWHEYRRSPVFRFQLLVMSVAPLLPVVDIFDNVVAELAWIFFLVPLLAIFYLALISTRLSLRTTELQQSLADLRSARQRQDELRDYASLVTRIQEAERKRLARELHDDTAQALIALSLGLDGLGRAVDRVDLPQSDRDWLTNLQELADHTLDGVRRACRDLRPSILDDLGLQAALEWLCDSSSSRGVASSFTCTGDVCSMSPETEIAIFRIAQEALSNVWRHAQAARVEMSVTYLPESLLLRIQDNGRGFLPTRAREVSADSQSGLGLAGMRERAMLIGADLQIDTLPGRGCTVTLTLPPKQAS